MHSFTLFLAAASLFDLSIAGYALEDDYMTDFYGAFDFFTAPDPTNGTTGSPRLCALLTSDRVRQICRRGYSKAVESNQCLYHRARRVGRRLHQRDAGRKAKH